MQTTRARFGKHLASVVFFVPMASNVVKIRPDRQIKPGAEYVSGSPYMAANQRVLPQFDDLASSPNVLSHQTIDNMLADPDVYAGLMLLALMALNEKLVITPAISETPAEIEAKQQDNADPTKPSDPPVKDTVIPSDGSNGTSTEPATDKQGGNPTVDPTQDTEGQPAAAAPVPADPQVQLAADIADFCQRQVDRVPKFAASMFQMVYEGMAHGNKVAEQVLEIAERGQDAGRWCLKTLKPKPRESVAFVVDAFNNEVGMLGAKPGQMSIVNTTIVPSERDVIPREKFAVFTYRPKDNDPRGQTALLAARNGWEMKQRSWPEYLLFLMVSAIPGILATLPGAADEQVVYEDDGVTPKYDSTGEVVKVSAAQFLLNMLSKMRNHQVGVAPDGTNFTLLEANSEGEVFTRALDKFGSEITMAILFQQLATRDSTHQTKGATGSQARVIDLIVFWLRDTAAEMVKYDIFKPMVRYNFGDDAADELLPKVSYGDTESKDWGTDAQAAAALADKLTESQWTHVTTQLGIPAPTESELAFKRMAKLALAQVQQDGGNTSDGDTKDTAPDAGKGKGGKPPTTTKPE